MQPDLHAMQQAHERRINRELRTLGDRPQRDRLPRAKAIAEQMCGQDWRFEFDCPPKGPVTVILTPANEG